MADDDPREDEQTELFAPPGPRRSTYTAPKNDEATLRNAANVFSDDDLAEALAEQFGPSKIAAAASRHRVVGAQVDAPAPALAASSTESDSPDAPAEAAHLATEPADVPAQAEHSAEHHSGSHVAAAELVAEAPVAAESVSPESVPVEPEPWDAESVPAEPVVVEPEPGDAESVSAEPVDAESVPLEHAPVTLGDVEPETSAPVQREEPLTALPVVTPAAPVFADTVTDTDVEPLVSTDGPAEPDTDSADVPDSGAENPREVELGVAAVASVERSRFAPDEPVTTPIDFDDSAYKRPRRHSRDQEELAAEAPVVVPSVGNVDSVLEVASPTEGAVPDAPASAFDALLAEPTVPKPAAAEAAPPVWLFARDVLVASDTDESSVAPVIDDDIDDLPDIRDIDDEPAAVDHADEEPETVGGIDDEPVFDGSAPDSELVLSDDGGVEADDVEVTTDMDELFGAVMGMGPEVVDMPHASASDTAEVPVVAVPVDVKSEVVPDHTDTREIPVVTSEGQTFVTGSDGVTEGSGATPTEAASPESTESSETTHQEAPAFGSESFDDVLGGAAFGGAASAAAAAASAALGGAAVPTSAAGTAPAAATATATGTAAAAAPADTVAAVDQTVGTGTVTSVVDSPAASVHRSPFEAEEVGEEPTPRELRVGRASRLFWLWFAANSSLVSVAFGAIIFSLGMSLRQSIVSILAGVALSFLPLGLGTLASKRSGQPTMVVSRATFGIVGNILPAVIALISRLFWGAALLWILSAGTASILRGANMVGNFSAQQATLLTMAIGFLIALVIAFFGYHTIVRVQLVLSIVSAVLIAGFIALTIGNLDVSAALTVPDGSWALLVTGAVLVFSFVGLVWANSSGDLARYQRSSGSSGASMLWATFGTAVPSFVLIAYGALLAASRPSIAAGLVTDPFDALGRLLPSWYPVPLVAATALSLLSGVAISLYSSAFALQATRIRGSRPFLVVLLGVVLAVIAGALALTASGFESVFRDFATTLAVPVAAWAGIFASDTMIRNRRYDTPSLLRRGGIYADVRWVNLSMLVVASIVGFGLTSATVGWLGWEGYLFGLFGVLPGSTLAATDIGVLVALVIGVITPLVSGVPAVRRQEIVRS